MPEDHAPGGGAALAGVRSIVERFGGQLELDSREDEGSTFAVRLPMHREPKPPAQGAP